jgi:hypothetical protein
MNFITFVGSPEDTPSLIYISLEYPVPGWLLHLLVIRRRAPTAAFFAKFAAEKIAQITRAAAR